MPERETLLEFAITPPPGKAERFLAIITAGKSKLALIREVIDALKVPRWYSLNWDALSDFLCDLEWIREPEVVLWCPSASGIAMDDLSHFVAILDDAIKFHRSDTDKQLRAIFHESDREACERALAIEQRGWDVE